MYLLLDPMTTPSHPYVPSNMKWHSFLSLLSPIQCRDLHAISQTIFDRKCYNTYRYMKCFIKRAAALGWLHEFSSLMITNVIIQVMTKLLNVTVREINDVIWRPQPGLDRRALSVECLINTTGKDRAARWLRYESEAQSTNMPLDVSLRHATCRERLIGCSPR